MSNDSVNCTQIRWAVDGDAHQILEIWREVSEWLAQIGQPLWEPAQFTLAETRSLISRREVCVGLDQGQLKSCMQVSNTDDVFWPEENLDPAFYIHKIAVRRSYRSKGMPKRMLDWVGAQKADKKYLRLDCDPRPSLLNLYKSLGFANYEPVPVHRGGFLVQRMQRRILPPSGQ